jgi:ubiquinone/menaquinone biosynthesis C-methylase UbiE
MEVIMEAGTIIERPDAGGPDPLRAQLRGMWASVAPAWEQHADYVETRGAPVAAKLLELSAPWPGDRVLELACGTGSVGIAAAARVAPGGEVVLSDVVPEMTAIAAGRAEARGLRNVSTRVLDLERIDEPDESYDVVLCLEGLMLVPDPARAAREIRRVLRPGGRTAVAVWGRRERNPWLGVVFDTVSEQLGTRVPPLGIPHPFSLDDPEQLRKVLAAAGFADVAVSEVAVPYRAASVEDWWARSTALAGPLARKLASLPAPVAEALRTRARESASAYETPDGLEFPGITLIAAATG